MLSKSSAPERPLPAQQRGAALIVALLVAAIVTLLVTSVASDSLVTFRRVENQLHGQQAFALLLGAEAVARSALLEDLKTSEIDSDSEFWSTEDLLYPTEYGSIQGRLYDLSGRINLANLLERPTESRRYSADQQRFIRLLQTLPLATSLDQNDAEQLANAVFDWLDPDDDERAPGGAEQYHYSSMEPPGRPANRMVGSVSELRWVKGMTPEVYRALRPHLSIWPSTGSTLNVNTASIEVLRSLNADNILRPMAESDAQAIIEYRQEEAPFGNLEFFTEGQLAALEIDTENIGFSSTHFLLTSQTVFLSRTYRLRSVIHRDAAQGVLKVVARSQSRL